MKLSLVVTAVFLLSIIGETDATAAGRTFEVCASGCQFHTLRAALNAATPGGVVALRNGSYSGGITINKPVTLTGAGMHSTVIKGGGPVITIGPRVRATISDLTIRGGSADVGGGVLNRGTLTLQRVDVGGNSARDQGSGITNEGSLVLLSSNVHDNHVDTAFGSGGGIKNRGALVIRDSSIRGNSATAGGGIDNSGPLVIASSQVTGNSAVLGGGIDNAGSLTMRDSVIADNDVQGDPAIGGGQGGGINNVGRVTLQSSEVSHNRAKGDPYHVNDETGFGGGIYTFKGSVVLRNSVVRDNQADRDGGGIYNNGGQVNSFHTTFANNVPNNCNACT